MGSNLAIVYMQSLSSQSIKDLFNIAQKQQIEGNFGLMDLLHHITAGFKALNTQYSYNGLDELRQACGGAGYT
jgi:hypothetical protein